MSKGFTPVPGSHLPGTSSEFSRLVDAALELATAYLTVKKEAVPFGMLLTTDGELTQSPSLDPAELESLRAGDPREIARRFIVGLKPYSDQFDGLAVVVDPRDGQRDSALLFFAEHRDGSAAIGTVGLKRKRFLDPPQLGPAEFEPTDPVVFAEGEPASAGAGPAWAQTLTPEALEAVKALIDNAMGFATGQLSQHGSFAPFAVAHGTDGSPVYAMADPGAGPDGEVNGQESIESLLAGFHADRGRLTAACVAADVRISPDSVGREDAVMLHLEHADGMSTRLVWPYRVDPASGLDVGDPAEFSTPAAVWTA